jgi:hypothetical protein
MSNDEWKDALSEEGVDEEIKPIMSEEQRNLLLQQGLLMQQFLQSEKFVTFINMNYDLMRDDDTKMMYVVEVPDDVAAERAMKIMKQQVKEAPVVQPATLDETKAMLKKIKEGL